ncbi:hypothetical protein F511_14619 [Dorcoceras hygrometricum]|uniref:Uncharacterized protein n=1 Tax=Dorcoceras hygrometricum TaxID=472368 RepID=A0A2Z7A5S7_9LAMI|nr:hypothetical protein F511_14619 [Dorcoceras hygrometricum]
MTQLCKNHDPVIFRYDDSADHHSIVVFRHDDSVGHHIDIYVGHFRHDGSAGRSQRVMEFSSQKDQAQYVCLNAHQNHAYTNTYNSHAHREIRAHNQQQYQQTDHSNSTRKKYSKYDIKAAKSSSIRTSTKLLITRQITQNTAPTSWSISFATSSSRTQQKIPTRSNPKLLKNERTTGHNREDIELCNYFALPQLIDSYLTLTEWNLFSRAQSDVNVGHRADRHLEYFRTLYSLSSSTITLDCYCSPESYFRRFPSFSPSFGARLVALSSSSLRLSIDTSLETGVVGFEEHEVVTVFVCLRDFGPVVLLFFNSFGFEKVVDSVEFVVKLLGQ